MDFVRLKDCTKDVSGHLASLHISADLCVESEMKLLLARAGKSPSNFSGPTLDKDCKDFILTFHLTRDFDPTSKKEQSVKRRGACKSYKSHIHGLICVGEQAKLCAVSRRMLPRTRRQLLKEPSTWTAASPSGFWSNLIP